MANNRLWAVCRKDNSAHVVLKYYPGGFYHVNSDPSVEEDWFIKHDHPEEAHGTGDNITFVKECYGKDEEDPVEKYDFREYRNPKIFLKADQK